MEAQGRVQHEPAMDGRFGCFYSPIVILLHALLVRWHFYTPLSDVGVVGSNVES